MTEEAIIARAAAYGREVQIAEDAGREQERRQARKAWTELLRSLRGTIFEVPARDAHWTAYETFVA